ncbi:FAD-dependent oxidoreductase [Nonomuraea wenchangensis]|uniref:FAD-dependent oxidoreductase n=1 Tax=Nonomuraea wenchangensis TaxID=568860 RepID=UPI003720DB3A
MTDHWDSIVDVLVAGSGAAGLTAAIAAADRGLDALVVESTPRWGGTTSVSGGGLWMPANPLMLRAGGFARTGVDPDFGRGRTVYDNYYGDPRVKPNPNLGPLEKGPFRAFRVHPGDLGTKGGLLTDEHARVLREDGGAIPGLYAAGNTTASVMGRTYPGPGSTIGPAVVFGYRAARHAARHAAGDPA